MSPVSVAAYTLTCAAGHGIDAVRVSLASRASGLTPGPWTGSNISTWLGRTTGLESAVPRVAPEFDSRNNRLAEYGLAADGFSDAVGEAVRRYGATRCGIVAGTSTSSIGRTETAYANLDAAGEFAEEFRQPRVHNPHSTTDYVADRLGLHGPSMTISTACSSSAKVFAAAARWLEAGIVDAVVVAGIDSLCLSVIHGFHSLQLVSAEPCKPFDQQRDGINLGEAAGFALLVRDGENDRESEALCKLVGYGESCDAYHMSSAHPDGLGAELAMRDAVARAGLKFDDIGYINMHGTGTRSNDEIEARVCRRLFSRDVPASSTKGWTGHTLGAAGITEAVIAMDALLTGLLPGNLNAVDFEPEFADNLLAHNREARVGHVMTNSFGFGGNNCSLIFGLST